MVKIKKTLELMSNKRRVVYVSSSSTPQLKSGQEYPAILVCSLRVRKPSEINIKIFFFNTDDVLDGLYALDIIIIIELSFCFVYISGKNRVSYVRSFAIPHYRSRVTQERVTIT